MTHYFDIEDIHIVNEALTSVRRIKGEKAIGAEIESNKDCGIQRVTVKYNDSNSLFLFGHFCGFLKSIPKVKY